MAERIETVLRETFHSLSHMENGDLVFDRNDGGLVPVDQILKDPLHIDKLDFLDTDRLGGTKLGPIDAFELEEEERETLEEPEEEEVE
jgi:hypothetical protein